MLKSKCCQRLRGHDHAYSCSNVNPASPRRHWRKVKLHDCLDTWALGTLRVSLLAGGLWVRVLVHRFYVSIIVGHWVAPSARVTNESVILHCGPIRLAFSRPHWIHQRKS